MSAKKRREHKLGNQVRKQIMLARNHRPVSVPIRAIQNGKYTRQAVGIFEALKDAVVKVWRQRIGFTASTHPQPG